MEDKETPSYYSRLFLQRSTSLSPTVGEYRQLIRDNENVAAELWQSEKARIEWRLTREAGILPESITIGRKIISAGDEEAILAAVEAAVNRGFWVGVRTCFVSQPPESGWVMGIGSKEGVSVRDFMNEIYPQWIAEPGLSELIIMANPPKLGSESEKQNHFVCRLEKRNDTLHLEMRLETDQLRAIEGDAYRSDMIIAKVKLSLLGLLLNVRVSFGKSYLKKKEGEEEIAVKRRDMGAGLSRIEPDMLFKEVNLDRLAFMKRDLLECPSLTNKSVSVVQGVIERLVAWYNDPTIQLSERLESLGQIGLEFSEWQGRVEEGGVQWFKIYGLRGTKDEKRTNLRPGEKGIGFGFG